MNAAAQRSHQQHRKQVRLARSRIAEDPDVGVRIAALVEGVDQHGGTAGATGAHNQSAWLLNVGAGPREESGQRARVEDPLATEAINTSGKSRDVAVEHSKRARLELA